MIFGNRPTDRVVDNQGGVDNDAYMEDGITSREEGIPDIDAYISGPDITSAD
jgi:hypothetical protein